MNLIALPMNGAYPAMDVPTVMAQNASWSHGSRYPVKLESRVSPKRQTPITQLNSRGGLYEPVKNTRHMWRNTQATMPCAAHRCMLRRMTPKATELRRSSMRSYAWVVEGT